MHVAEHAEDDQVAHEHAQRRAQERVLAAAVPAGPHVAPRSLGRGRDLQHDLPEEQHERARDVEAVGQERAVARVRALLGVGPADRQDRLVRLAGEQVPATGPAVAQEADPGRPARLDLRAVRRRGAGHDPPRLLLHPAERGDVLVGAEQDPGLAGAGLRRQVRLPLDEPVAALGDPAGHVRSAPVAHGVAEHREAEAVDLEVDDAGDVGGRAATAALGDATRHAQGVLVVVVRAGDDLQDHPDRGDEDRGEQRPAERVDLDVVRQHLVGEHEHDRVHEQHQDEPDRQHVGQAQRGDDRRQDGVEQRDDQGDEEGRAAPGQSDAGQDPGHEPHGRGRQDPADDHAKRAQARRRRLPPGCAVQRC